MKDLLLRSHGGALVNLYETIKENEKLFKNTLPYLPRLVLNERQICDLELIMNGGFSPLSGFLNEDEYVSVITKMRLPNGILWPIPIVLDVHGKDVYSVGGDVLLCDTFDNPLAVIRVESIYKSDKEKEAKAVYGTKSQDHFGVNYLYGRVNEYCLGGKIYALHKIEHLDYPDLRLTPAELQAWFFKKNWKHIIGFQTRNPIHKAHFSLIKDAAKNVGGKVLIHPSVGLTKDGDIDAVTRIKCYQIIQDKYAKDFSKLNLLPLAMRMAGPKEALLHAIIRKNYGCTHFIIGRNHADPGNNRQGIPFYKPYEAQELACQFAKEIGIEILCYKEMVYEEKSKKYVSVDNIKKTDRVKKISGTDFRKMLFMNEKIPGWFSFPEIIKFLRINAKYNRGLTVFFTGLPSSGKSTLSRSLGAYIMNTYHRKVTLLDGDIVRKNLSKGLGFSKEDRKTNIRRIGFVASEITKHGGIALCAAISPYKDARKEVRDIVSVNGVYVEVYVSTPLELCKERDIKGLYKKMKVGLIKGVTGVDDAYERPINPEITVNTSGKTIKQSLRFITAYLEKRKLL